MKFFVSIFIIFMIAARPVLPLVNYAVNYEYIVSNLCENKNIPESTCKGKCYVEKELAKTEKESNTTQTFKLSMLDVFLSNDSFQSIDMTIFKGSNLSVNSTYLNFHLSEFSSKIFHPPLG